MNIIETNFKYKEMGFIKNVDYLIVHHTAATRDLTVDEIHQEHLNNGWSGIGYHFYIRKDGKIYRGRPEKNSGAHCENYNSISLGICLSGNFEVEQPTDNQLKSLTELLRYLRKKYDNFKLVGHKDLNATACPGKYLYSRLLSVDANANEEYVKVFMSNNKLSVVLENGDKFTHSFTNKNELLRKLSIGLKITK